MTMIAGPDGWRLAPEGAAVHPVERVAVIADVHLGYEWARAKGGDCLPSHSLDETLAKLTTLLDRAPCVDRLVVAGDLVESAKPCPRTASDVRSLVAWLHRRGVEPSLVQGNHDPRRSPAPASIDIAGWTVAHGHRPISGDRTISGHHHPVLRAQGITAPCFLIGPRTIVLPAFTPNAAGLALGSPDTPDCWIKGDLRCVAALGGVALDFGPLKRLLDKIGRSVW